MKPEDWIQYSIKLAIESMEAGKGGPFAAIIVRQGKLISEGSNEVTSSCDPTAHAEVQAIRKACRELGSFQLEDCELYSSCEPCPMCLGAIYWARPARVYYAASRVEAADAGFDDEFIYQEIPKSLAERSIPFVQIRSPQSPEPFKRWQKKLDKIRY